MKFILLIIILSAFGIYNCDSQEGYRKPIPLTEDTLSARLYLIKKAKELNIDNLNNGFDSLQIRIWHSRGAIINASLLIIKKTKGNWSADYYDMIKEWDNLERAETLIIKNIIPVQPKSGWDTVINKLIDLKILSLPNMDAIPGLKDYWEDGSTYTIEVATKNQYRYYKYHVPEEFKSEFWQAKAMCEILELTASEFDTYRQTFWHSLPQPEGWTNDFEGLFTDKQEKILDSIIAEFEKKTSIEISIVTLDTNMTTKEKFDDFVLHIHNTWGVGKKIINNGIVIGISSGYRQMRISNGPGIENILSDSETKLIITNDFIPFFKEADYYGGTLNGLKALIAKLYEKIKHH